MEEELRAKKAAYLAANASDGVDACATLCFAHDYIDALEGRVADLEIEVRQLLIAPEYIGVRVADHTAVVRERDDLKARVAELEQYRAKYQILMRSIDHLTQKVLSGQLLGPHLVERRGHGQGERGGPGGHDLPFAGVPELHDPGGFRGPEAVPVQVQGQGPLAGDGVQAEQGVGGGGVEQLSGHGASEEK
jgi:hypothetical protein